MEVGVNIFPIVTLNSFTYHSEPIHLPAYGYWMCTTYWKYQWLYGEGFLYVDKETSEYKKSNFSCFWMFSHKSVFVVIPNLKQINTTNLPSLSSHLPHGLV